MQNVVLHAFLCPLIAFCFIQLSQMSQLSTEGSQSRTHRIWYLNSHGVVKPIILTVNLDSDLHIPLEDFFLVIPIYHPSLFMHFDHHELPALIICLKLIILYVTVTSNAPPIFHWYVCRTFKRDLTNVYGWIPDNLASKYEEDCCRATMTTALQKAWYNPRINQKQQSHALNVPYRDP